MDLWPGFYRGKYSELPDPILDEIPTTRINRDGELTDQYTAHCTAETVEYQPGEQVFKFFPHDEIHYVLKGAAELVYSLAATSHTVQKTASLSEGDCLVIPCGARATWTVGDQTPLRFLWITMPGVPRITR